MNKYVKRPVIVEATQFDGYNEEKKLSLLVKIFVYFGFS